MKINILSSTESLDLAKDAVLSALLNGGKELRDLRRLVKVASDFNQSVDTQA